MIYLDYNATTPLCDAAREAMLPYLGHYFGNPSSVHAAGREARAAIDNARDKLGVLLRRKPGEIIFTGGATESCNLGVLGLARSSSSRGGHIISNKAEHHAVLHPLEHLEQHEGFEVTWLNVSESGIVDLDQLADSIRPVTRLVSIMTANNETGVIQPMREISQICRDRGVLLHSDMVQAFGKRMSMSLLSMSRVLLRTSFMGQRVPAFFVFAPASRSSQSCSGRTRKSAAPRDRKTWLASREWLPPRNDIARSRDGAGTQSQLRDQLWRGIAHVFPDAQQNGDPTHRLANTLNASFIGVGSETMLMALDLEGICASSGSACMLGQ